MVSSMTKAKPDDRQGNSEQVTCPECGSSRQIAVYALMWSMQTPDGGDPTHSDVPWGGEEWPDGTPAQCMQCGWKGENTDLSSPYDDEEVDEGEGTSNA